MKFTLKEYNHLLSGAVVGYHTCVTFKKLIPVKDTLLRRWGVSEARESVLHTVREIDGNVSFL